MSVDENSYLYKGIKSTAAVAAKSFQSCPTLCDPIDGSPLGSSVPGILQARILGSNPGPPRSGRALDQQGSPQSVLKSHLLCTEQMKIERDLKNNNKFIFIKF